MGHPEAPKKHLGAIDGHPESTSVAYTASGNPAAVKAAARSGLELGNLHHVTIRFAA